MSDIIPDYAYMLFNNICDIIGPSNEWPEKILKFFWTQNVKHWDRFILTTFVVVNGLNPEIFLEWIDVMHLARDNSALNEFKSLLHTFTTNTSKWNKAYGYHILNHRYDYLTGEVKCYLPMATVRPQW